MVSRVKKLLFTIPQPQGPILLPAMALWSVTSQTGMGVYASSDTLYKDAVFGRDSLEVAEDLLLTKQRLVRTILLTLGRLQGTRYNSENEEEPGKIIHEYRSVTINGRKLSRRSQDIFDELSKKWGGTSTEMAYYGSIDSTPLFLRVLERYCRKYGDSILNKTVTRRDGSTLSMRAVALEAMQWLIEKIQLSDQHLLEFQHQNPEGIMNQAWKDSNEFYVHTDGRLANHTMPIASIEVQGLAYDALVAATYLDPERTSLFQSLALKLQQSCLQTFWLKKESYFALGSDFDERGKPRLIRTRTANPAALLDTCIFDTLPQSERKMYVSSVAKTIMSAEFITDAGIRSRSLQASHLITYWDYHGSFVSWPKETYDIAKGFRRQGFPILAKQLEHRLLNIYLRNRRYPEFLYVDELGRVLSIGSDSDRHRSITVIRSSNYPERVQAWTVSAIIAILDSMLLDKVKILKKPTRTWQSQLEQAILGQIPAVDLYVNPFSLAARYPKYRYTLDDPYRK